MQQQEQCAGSPQVKILYLKHTVEHSGCGRVDGSAAITDVLVRTDHPCRLGSRQSLLIRHRVEQTRTWDSITVGNLKALSSLPGQPESRLAGCGWSDLE
jgi:hypothetical protein